MLIFYKEALRDIRYHLILFKVYINGMVVAVEAAKQGVTMGDDTVSGSMFVCG